jgi:heme exporter protein D
VNDFFAMGGYAFYIWSSIGLAFISLVLGIMKPLMTKKKILRQLQLKRQRDLNA